MTFEEFMLKVDRFYNENEFELRYGQSIMNMLHQIWPDWYNRITGTDLDCFYDDGIVKYTLEYLEKEWDQKKWIYINIIRTFNDWLNGLEGFALRSERAYDELTSIPKDTVDHWRNIVVPWLKGAFDSGYEAGELNKEFLIQDLKNEIRTQRLEIAALREERRNLIDKDYPPGYNKDF